MQSKLIVIGAFATIVASAPAGSLQAAEIKAAATITYVVTSSGESKLLMAGRCFAFIKRGVIIATEPASHSI